MLLVIIPITALGLATVDYGENGFIGNFKTLFKTYGIRVMKSLLSQSKYVFLRRIYIYIFKTLINLLSQVRSQRQVLSGN